MNALAPHRTRFRPQVRDSREAYVAQPHWWLKPAHAAAVVIAMVFLNAAFATFVVGVFGPLKWWAWPIIVVAFSALVLQPWKRPT